MTSASPETVDWLLDNDPALRWQVERDLSGAPSEIWQATRAKVATEGFGARLLALQDPDGQWAGGAYFPGPGFTGEGLARPIPPEDQGEDAQPWIATTWTLNTLRDWGLDAGTLGDTAERLAANSRWEYNDLPYWGGEVDCCINAYTLANGVWLGADVSTLPGWFAEHQLADGGWNCEWVEGSTRSSFHSTLNSLRGLLSYETAIGGNDELHTVRRRAEEYLLARRLTRRLSTDEPPGWWVNAFGYPFRWVYTALNAVDYFRSTGLADGEPPDERLADAIEIIRAARGSDGRWVQQLRRPGLVWFEIDVGVGEASPWLTFFATRALDWWDGATPKA